MALLETPTGGLRDRALALAAELGIDPGVWYLRVLEEGTLAAGDEIARIRSGPEGLTIREVAKLASNEKGNRELALKALRVPALAASWREWLQERLAQAGNAPEEQGAPEK